MSAVLRRQDGETADSAWTSYEMVIFGIHDMPLRPEKIKQAIGV